MQWSKIRLSAGLQFRIAIFVVAWPTQLQSGAQPRAPKTAPLRFEAASVRQDVSGSESSQIMDALPGRFVARNVPVRFLILYAYDLRDHQLIGAPEWTWDKPFDVAAIYPGERRPNGSEVRMMVQSLLADRFSLKLHRAQRELPAYDLVVARKDGRLGPQLQKADRNCAARMADDGEKAAAGSRNSGSPSATRPACGMVATRRFLRGGARSMKDLAVRLQSMLGRPVVDKTGLAGAYDIDLHWAPTTLRANVTASTTANGAPSIFSALREQLGLKLVSHKERFEVFVVDEIRPPGPN